MSSAPSLHGADASNEWIAIVVDPDFCKVGPKLTPFDTTSRLGAWAPINIDAKVRGRTHMVYRDGDMICGVQGNAGNGVVSQVSLGGGYVKIVQPDPRVRVMIKSKPMAHHDSKCMVNTNAAGAGGAEGQIQTKEKDKRLDQWLDDGAEVVDDANASAEALNTRYRPVNARGQALPAARAATKTSIRDYLNPKNFTAKPNASGLVKGLRGASKVLGPAANIAGGVSSGYEQLLKDVDKYPQMGQMQRTTRAAGRGVANTTGAAAGAWAGAKAGAFVGAWFGPWGAVIGGVAGGIYGGLKGAEAGDWYADQILDKPF